MMSPFHLHFRLGAEGITNGARTVQTLRWSLNWTSPLSFSGSGHN